MTQFRNSESHEFFGTLFQFLLDLECMRLYDGTVHHLHEIHKCIVLVFYVSKYIYIVNAGIYNYTLTFVLLQEINFFLIHLGLFKFKTCGMFLHLLFQMPNN